MREQAGRPSQKRLTEDLEGSLIGREGVETDILWEPEIGTCSVCGCRGCRVRQYSSEGRVRKFCFTCWDSAQEPRVMSSMEWEDDDRVVFTYSEPPSKAA